MVKVEEHNSNNNETVITTTNGIESDPITVNMKKTFAFKDLRNESGYEFTDISSEEFRVYEFSSKYNIDRVFVHKPVALSVSQSGGHRILDEDGVSHYIPSGWIKLSWVVKDGQPHFVK